MKKIISAFLIGFVSAVSADLPTNTVVDIASSSAIDNTISGTVSDLKMPTKSFSKEEPTKPAFFYVQFAAAETDITRMHSVLPGLGIGYRRLAGDGAADISVRGIGNAEKKNGRVFWTFPKTSYIHYLQPDEKQSFYIGGGLAWGGLSSKYQNFIGIVPSVTGGYEFVRKSTVLGFTELNISQPAIAVYRNGAFSGPIAECTVGIGF